MDVDENPETTSHDKLVDAAYKHGAIKFKMLRKFIIWMKNRYKFIQKMVVIIDDVLEPIHNNL